MADVAVLSRRAAAIAAARGIRLETVGLNPYHSCADVPLRLPTQRYLTMQQAFDEVGPDGRRMMRLTASLQIAIDLLPGQAGREQWLVANLAGPPLAAAFANSAVAAGRPDRAWSEAATGYSPEAEALLAIARSARPAARAAPPAVAALVSGGVA